MDLCQDESINKLQMLLASEKTELALLINNAACGILSNVGEGSLEEHPLLTSSQLGPKCEERLTAITFADKVVAVCVSS